MEIVNEEEDKDSDEGIEDLLERAKEKYLSFLDNTLDKTQFDIPPLRPKTLGTFPESPQPKTTPSRPVTPPPRPPSASITPQTVQRNLFPLAP